MIEFERSHRLGVSASVFRDHKRYSPHSRNMAQCGYGFLLKRQTLVAHCVSPNSPQHHFCHNKYCMCSDCLCLSWYSRDVQVTTFFDGTWGTSFEVYPPGGSTCQTGASVWQGEVAVVPHTAVAQPRRSDIWHVLRIMSVIFYHVCHSL